MGRAARPAPTPDSRLRELRQRLLLRGRLPAALRNTSPRFCGFYRLCRRQSGPRGSTPPSPGPGNVTSVQKPLQTGGRSRALRREVPPLSGWDQPCHMASSKAESPPRLRSETHPAGCDDGRRGRDRGPRKLPEAGKGEDMGSPLGPRTGTHEVAVPPPRCRPAGPARPTAPGAARPRMPAIPSRRFRGNSSWRLWKSRPRARGRTREPASRTRPSPLPGRCSPLSRRPRASARRVTLPGLHLRVVGYLPGVSDVARLLPRKDEKAKTPLPFRNHGCICGSLSRGLRWLY